jgi:hypothetical protein
VSDITSYNYGGGWVHVFRPNLILDFRGGTNDRYFDVKTDSSVGLGPMEQLGFTDVDRFGGMSLGLLTPWTGAGFGGPSPRSNPVWNLAANLSWIRGNHSIKTGYQFINVERLQIGNNSAYSFNNDVTADPQNLANTGASLASALMGLPYVFSGSLPDQSKVDFSIGTWSAYVQDEWKVSSKVTVNFGTQFDYVAYVGSVNRGLDYTGLGNSTQSPSLSTATRAQIDAKRPVSFMGGGIFYSRSIGESNYDSLQIKADRRFANGLQFLVSYSWPKSIDTGSSGWFGAEGGTSNSSIQDYFHPNSNRSVSSYNVPHFLSISSIYELPFGKGKPYANSGPTSWIVGGWQANTIMQLRSGRPYNLQMTGDVANISYGNFGRRPHYLFRNAAEGNSTRRQVHFLAGSPASPIHPQPG